MTNEARFRYLGTTNDVVDCQRENCPKVGLSHTVVIVPIDADGVEGEPTYYGATCAAKVLGVRGGGRAVLKSASAQREITFMHAKDARSKLELYGLPEVGEPDTFAMVVASELYLKHNPGVRGAFGDELRRYVREMLKFEQRTIADARALKLRGFTD